MTLPRYTHFIDGEFVAAFGSGWFTTENPYLGETWAEIARGTPEDVDRAVIAAHRALNEGPWGKMTASERGLVIHRFGDAIARRWAELAALEVRDNGKLLSEMAGQLQYIPKWYHYFGGLADKIEGSVIPLDKKGYFNFTRREPVGVVAIITPWNSPLMLLSWKLAPALAAGCTVVIKPSEFTSASTVALMEAAVEAGIPKGVINVVCGFGTDVGAPLVSHPLVAKISFTGSDRTGRHIARTAGEQLKHVGLELGGKSPNIIFDDADLEQAVNGAVSGIFAATGQTCIAGSRLLVQASIYDEVMDRLLPLAGSARLGDPMLSDTQVGPITTPPQLAKVLDYINIGKEQGATVALGGKRPDSPELGNGWFVEPTIFTGVDPAMRIAQEEIFGPVLSVIPFRDEQDALRIANGVRFGLGAGVWTRDIPRAFRMSERIEAGTVWVNTYRAVSYMSPFGGYKDSGIGRENGQHAIYEYLQTKSVWINTGAPNGNPFVMK